MGAGSVQLARIFGIRIGASPSWFVVLFLMIYWLSGLFDDMLLAQSAVDRFRNSAYDFVVEGESYRPRLKPKIEDAGAPPPAPSMKPPAIHRRSKRRR